MKMMIAAVCAGALVIGGCGSAQSGLGSSSALQRRGDAGMLAFARCMRAHGVPMQDPFNRPGHSGLSIDLPQQSPATASGYRACGHDLAATEQLKAAGAARIPASTRLGLIHYAQCMRSHGVPMLDPSPQGTLSLGTVPGLSDAIGRYSAPFRTADRACRGMLPAGVTDDGSGP